jgi:hypothetical protein
MGRLIAKAAALGLAAVVSLAGPAYPATPAGDFEGCHFDACSAGTGECCSLARDQEASCRSADAQNATLYDQTAQGDAARAAIRECVRCAGVYVQTFCE